jgi:hypothetical protein
MTPPSPSGLISTDERSVSPTMGIHPVMKKPLMIRSNALNLITVKEMLSKVIQGHLPETKAIDMPNGAPYFLICRNCSRTLNLMPKNIKSFLLKFMPLVYLFYI